MRSYSTMVWSRATLATMLAAMIDAQVRSPLTTAIWGSGASGTSQASTRRYSAGILSPATAPAVARCRALMRPRLSTWAWSTAQMEKAKARRRMMRSRRSRSSGVSSLESLSPGILAPTSSTTAPPTTGPASGLMTRDYRRFASGTSAVNKGLLLGRLFLTVLRRLGFGRAGTSQLPALADAGLFADLATEVVEPALPDVAMAQDLDLVDPRRVNQERALDPDAMSDAPNREVLPQTAAGDT